MSVGPSSRLVELLTQKILYALKCLENCAIMCNPRVSEVSKKFALFSSVRIKTSVIHMPNISQSKLTANCSSHRLRNRAESQSWEAWNSWKSALATADTARRAPRVFLCLPVCAGVFLCLPPLWAGRGSRLGADGAAQPKTNLITGTFT